MDRCLNNLWSNIKANIMQALFWSNLSIKLKNGTNTCVISNHESYLKSTIFTLDLTWGVEIFLKKIKIPLKLMSCQG
jgi:hypothetical protein